ncbi:MAG: sulfatase-like hydrolase/transferase [archaeon]
MKRAPLMFRSREKKFNWRILSIIAVFFLITGGVKIFGLEAITGRLITNTTWDDPSFQQNSYPQPETKTAFLFENYSTSPANKSLKEVVGTVPGVPTGSNQGGATPLLTTASDNFSTTLVGVYYNRTMPNSDSYQIVPVPNAEIYLSSWPRNTSYLSNSSGVVKVFHTEEPVNLTVIAPGFLVDKHAFKTITNETGTVHFFLTIGKSKISLDRPTHFVMGKTANATFSVKTTFPDTILDNYSELSNVVLDAVFIKEINEKIYELSPHFQKKINLTEGTQQFSLVISPRPSLYARDLYLPKLHVKLLTSTQDIIHDNQEKINIGFLEAALNNSTINVTNPTSKTINNVLLSSNIFNEWNHPLFLSFSENNFDLPPFSSKTILFESQKAQGSYTGEITLTGTLPAAAGWDEASADTIFLSFSKNFPVHDVSLKAQTAPILSEEETKLELLLSNNGNFSENITLYTVSENLSLTESVILAPAESRIHPLIFNVKNLSKGIHELSFFAKIDNDFRPADNSHNISFFVGKNLNPENIVMLIFDGMGASYLSDELTPNIVGYQHRGFTATNMQVRIPSTTESHSILFTTQYKKDYDWRASINSISLPNNTVFDSARGAEHLVLGVMGQGDSNTVVDKMDAILHDNSSDWLGFKSSLAINGNLSESLKNSFIEQDNLTNYKGQTNSVYVDYDQWTADAVSQILRTLSNTSEKFLLVSNFAGTDHAGHSGPADYSAALAAADKQAKQVLSVLLETGLIENTLLVITADHGMCFREGTYGEYGYHASCSNPEAFSVPFIVLGPGISSQFSDSLSFNDDVWKTFERLLSLPEQDNSTGRILKEMFSSFSDAGVSSLHTTPLLIGSDSNTTVLVKNYGAFELAPTICFNTSFSLSCEQVSLQPGEEKPLYFHWKPLSSGIYETVAHILESDENPHNNRVLQTLETGIIEDVGVGDVWFSETEEKYDNTTKKILLNVEVCNHGTLSFDEKVEMHIWVNGCTDSWCNKTYNKIHSAAPGNCNKYKTDLPFGLKTGLQSIHFTILNNTDMNPDNNYKTLTTFIS